VAEEAVESGDGPEIDLGIGLSLVLSAVWNRYVEESGSRGAVMAEGATYNKHFAQCSWTPTGLGVCGYAPLFRGYLSSV